MAGIGDVICISCGEPVGTPPRFHLLLDGTPCPACRDRVLESTPAALPAIAARKGSEGEQGDPGKAQPELFPVELRSSSEPRSAGEDYEPPVGA